MDMMAVVKQFGGAEAAKRAVAAGADVLLMPADVPGTIDAVVAGVREGRYDERRLDASVRRILDLKRDFALPAQRTVDVERVRALVGDTAATSLARRVAERSQVLVRDQAGRVPLVTPEGRRPRILSITFARRADLGAGTTFDATLRSALAARYPQPPRRNDTPYDETPREDMVRSEYVSADASALELDRLVAAADSADVTILGAYVNIGSGTATAAAPHAFVDFARTLATRSSARPVLVSFGSPYLLQQVPQAGTYLIAWGGSPASQGAAARALLGLIPIEGRLPINIPPLAAVGSGVSRASR
jgi:beta-N-acetylhexosaminidase